MKPSKTLIIGITVVVFIIVLAVIGFKQDTKLTPLGKFAKCITESGAKMYGSFDCSVCEDQKEMFGKNFKYINYIECSYPSGAQKEECGNAGIAGYPTWEFKNGERIAGEINFEKLSEKSGCSLPQRSSP